VAFGSLDTDTRLITVHACGPNFGASRLTTTFPEP
jgi:hypothetical protein